MRLWRRKSEQSAGSESVGDASPAALSEEEWAERRRAVGWCEGCHSPRGPFVYLENDRHYCMPCATKVRWQMGMRVAGRRRDDIKDVPRPE